MCNKLSVTIITKNEEINIGKCLESVKWADEIIVVDSGSQDGTLKICRSYGCRIVENTWLGFGKTKQLAVDTAQHKWVLSIDADEVLSLELQQEIQELLRRKSLTSAFKIKRLSYYLGRPIRYCGWQKDTPLRLFNKQYGGFNAKPVHESVKTTLPVKTLENLMHHYTYPTLESHYKKIRLYGEISSEQMFQKGKRTTLLSAHLRGVTKFLKMYFLQLGFLDGKIGFLLCKNSGWGVWYKYSRLWELQQ